MWLMRSSTSPSPAANDALLPKNFPPYSEGRKASSTAGVIESQSVKTTEAGGPRGYAAEKMIKGRKRHIPTDTIGLLVDAIVPPRRYTGPRWCATLAGEHAEQASVAAPRIRRCGYAGAKLKSALQTRGKCTIEIVKRSDTAKGFVLLLRRYMPIRVRL
jgi:transposase